ncbi:MULTISPECIES: hypothetical protein [unclassified Sphingobium]|uniref:hypothetical protein n=1 Tax=unclassified Sphingobium TaxID=2611147 RepID=UPI0035A60DEB
MTRPVSSVADIAGQAEWLAHRYDPGHDAFHFRFVPRARHAELPFLTDAHLGEVDPVVLTAQDALAHAAAAGPVHFIFHSAYCCSTLLAAAFDIPGVAMALKEPVLLNDLVGWRHRGAQGAQVARVLDQSMRLLARPFVSGEAVVIKPSNIVNPLIPAMLAMRPATRALFLHAPLDAYLASIARKGMWGRLWVRDLFGKLLREGMIAPLGIAPDQYLALTDIQVAAAGWLAQQHQFAALARQNPGRVATLNSDTLIADPRTALGALAALFGLAMEAGVIDRIVDGPIFARDSKTGAAFGQAQRAQDARRGQDLFRDEVEKVGEWARAVAQGAGIPLDLPAPLLA